MASSLIYEWLEWWIALSLFLTAAEKYNGQQGDIWDMDMLLTTLGAIITGIVQLFNNHKSVLNRQNKSPSL